MNVYKYFCSKYFKLLKNILSKIHDYVTIVFDIISGRYYIKIWVEPKRQKIDSSSISSTKMLL